MDDTTIRITDPKQIRALTHPLRLQLMDVIAEEGEATATRCAELTGESVASCSFHLRMLAKYGYIQPADRRGREKPWRLVSRSRDIRPAADDPDSRRAVEAIAGLAVEHEVERIRRWLARSSHESHEWIDATTVTSSSIWATAEELSDLSASLHAIAGRFTGRVEHPDQRPPGSRPVRLFAVTSIDVDQEARHR